MCKIGLPGRLEKDTSSLGLTGMVVHSLSEFLSGEEMVELVFAGRTILTLIPKRGLFEGEVRVWLKVVKETCSKKCRVRVG